MNFTKMQILNILLTLILMMLPYQLKAEVIGKIEAHVGNKIITSYDIEGLDPATYKKLLSIPDEETRNMQLEQYKSQVLNFLIEAVIMETAAEREGIKVTDAEIDRAVSEIAANNKVSLDQFEKMIADEGLSLTQYRYQIKGQIIQARIRSQIFMPQVVITEEDIYNMVDEKGDEYSLKDKYKTKLITVQSKPEINKIIKNIKQGADFSDEAVKNSLNKIDVEGVRVNVIRSSVGGITESDIVLANASNAIIIGFNGSPSNATKEIAKEYNVDIRLYTIIYKCIEEIELAMKGMLDPEFEEKVIGNVEIRKIFKFSKVGNIAGSYITDGLVKNNCNVRLIRDGVIIYDGKIASIQREKTSVKHYKMVRVSPTNWRNEHSVL